MRHFTALLGTLAVLPTTTFAAIDEFQENQKKEVSESTSVQKVPWRNSTISYSNHLSAYSFIKSSQLSYDPKYSMSFSLRPRYYIKDDLSLRARMDLDIELTTSNSYLAREWVVSDLTVDLDYAPSWMTIPRLGIKVNPSVRLGFPTSKLSRYRSQMLSFGPAVALRRLFKLLDGRFLKNLGLVYAFRVTKYLNEYTTGQLSNEICFRTGDPNDPSDMSCVSDGVRNPSWRFVNTLGAQLKIMDKLTFSATMLFINDLLYKSDGFGDVGETNVNHRASLWAILDLSYDLLDYLWLSFGVSTFHPQLTPDSKIRAPIFNRYTEFFLTLEIPLDRFAAQVQTWTGWGQ